MAKKGELRTFFTLQDAIVGGGIHHFISSDIIPKDTDWHLVITKAANGKKKYRTDVAFYTGEFWSLGTTNPAKPVAICGYDADIRMTRTTGKPITDDADALRLAEAVLTQWRSDYIAALSALPDSEKAKQEALEELETAMHKAVKAVEQARKIEIEVDRLEGPDMPPWLLPSATTREKVIEHIKKEVSEDGRGKII